MPRPGRRRAEGPAARVSAGRSWPVSSSCPSSSSRGPSCVTCAPPRAPPRAPLTVGLQRREHPSADHLRVRVRHAAILRHRDGHFHCDGCLHCDGRFHCDGHLHRDGGLRSGEWRLRPGESVPYYRGGDPPPADNNLRRDCHAHRLLITYIGPRAPAIGRARGRLVRASPSGPSLAGIRPSADPRPTACWPASGLDGADARPGARPRPWSPPTASPAITRRDRRPRTPDRHRPCWPRIGRRRRPPRRARQGASRCATPRGIGAIVAFLENRHLQLKNRPSDTGTVRFSLARLGLVS